MAPFVTQLLRAVAILGFVTAAQSLSQFRSRSSGYKDPVSALLGTFLPQLAENAVDSSASLRPGQLVNAQARKRAIPPAKLARELQRALDKYSWFVTGNVDARYFSEAFSFVDPSVQTDNLQDYATGVARIFDQEETRMQVLKVEAQTEGRNKALLVTWRLEGRVNVLFRPRIKPFMIETCLSLDEQGLISAQEDRFLIPPWDVFISAFLPGFGQPPAPPIQR
eukprot:scaffold964_cov261-Pinguiococcus_pyrenoidosus.AAC.2